MGITIPFGIREMTLQELEEAKRVHEETSRTINIGPFIRIKPETFQRMLECGMSERVCINASGGQRGRPNGYSAHSIEYEGHTYSTETRDRLRIRF